MYCDILKAIDTAHFLAGWFGLLKLALHVLIIICLGLKLYYPGARAMRYRGNPRGFPHGCADWVITYRLRLTNEDQCVGGSNLTKCL